MIRGALYFISLFVGASFLPSTSFAQATLTVTPQAVTPQAVTPQKSLAIVSGQALYEKDLQPLIQGPLQQVQQQEYQIKRKALDELINQKLLEAEAKKQGLTPEKLLAQEVDAKVPEPTDSEVESYYLALKAQLNKPLQEVKPQIVQQLKQAKLQQARQNYLAQLRTQAQVVVNLAPPRVAVSHDPARVKGNPNAPVTLVEFADFQCPFCGRIEPTLNELLAKYDGEVRLAYRDFPLSQLHPYAQKAAEASRCAGEQGKFWDYHGLLFANQAKLDNPSLLQHARSLKLDEKKFEDCLSSGKYAAAVTNDLEEGKQAGVSGTPAFFINGIFLSGAVPPENFSRLIDDELARTRSGASARE